MMEAAGRRLLAGAGTLSLLATAGAGVLLYAGLTGQASPAVSAEDREVLAQAVEQFRQAQTFRFRVEIAHHWRLGDQPQVWYFHGEGAYQAPDRFTSRVWGPADTEFQMAVRGATVRALDTRGEVTKPSLASGGPVPGGAPFTVLALLRNAQEWFAVAEPAAAAVGPLRAAFTPPLAQVAALDAGHSRALSAFQQVSGQVEVDRATATLQKEMVQIRYRGPGGEVERVEVSLSFFAYNQAVNID